MPRTEALEGAPQPHHLKKALLITTAATVGVVGAGAAVIAYESQQSNKPSFQNEQQIPVGLTPVETVISERGIIFPPTEVPTVKPEPTAAATATVAAKKEVAPCIITTPELCATAERIERVLADGDTMIYIGLRLPPKTKIFSPIEGQVAKVEIPEGASLQGFEASIRDFKSNSTAFYITGDLIFPNYLSLNEKQGALIAEVGNRGIQNFGDYNVVITASHYDPTKGYAVDALDMLEPAYPNAFKQPAKKVVNTVSKPYFAGNVYLEKK